MFPTGTLDITDLSEFEEKIAIVLPRQLEIVNKIRANEW